MRMNGGEPTLMWTSDAPRSTAYASSWSRSNTRVNLHWPSRPSRLGSARMRPLSSPMPGLTAEIPARAPNSPTRGHGDRSGQGVRSLAVKTQSIRFRGGVARVAAWHGRPDIASVALQCRGAPSIDAIELLVDELRAAGLPRGHHQRARARPEPPARRLRLRDPRPAPPPLPRLRAPSRPPRPAPAAPHPTFGGGRSPRRAGRRRRGVRRVLAARRHRARPGRARHAPRRTCG